MSSDCLLPNDLKSATIDGDGVPVDLHPYAVKVARRLQALPNWRVYTFTLTKRGDIWELSIQNPDGAKVERIT